MTSVRGIADILCTWPNPQTVVTEVLGPDLARFAVYPHGKHNYLLSVGIFLNAAQLQQAQSSLLAMPVFKRGGDTGEIATTFSVNVTNTLPRTVKFYRPTLRPTTKAAPARPCSNCRRVPARTSPSTSSRDKLLQNGWVISSQWMRADIDLKPNSGFGGRFRTDCNDERISSVFTFKTGHIQGRGSTGLLGGHVRLREHFKAGAEHPRRAGERGTGRFRESRNLRPPIKGGLWDGAGHPCGLSKHGADRHPQNTEVRYFIERDDKTKTQFIVVRGTANHRNLKEDVAAKVREDGAQRSRYIPASMPRHGRFMLTCSLT